MAHDKRCCLNTWLWLLLEVTWWRKWSCGRCLTRNSGAWCV